MNLDFFFNNKIQNTFIQRQCSGGKENMWTCDLAETQYEPIFLKTVICSM